MKNNNASKKFKVNVISNEVYLGTNLKIIGNTIEIDKQKYSDSIFLVGMKNEGFTCFINATLQAIFRVSSFINWLMTDLQHINTKCLCFICAMKNVYLETQTTLEQFIRPNKVFDEIK